MMKNIWKQLVSAEKRKYPIKKDDLGRSIRKRCFELFDLGIRPSEVRKKLNIKFKTACTYYYQWKKQPLGLEMQYPVVRKILKNKQGIRPMLMESIARELGVNQEEAETHLEKPWAIKQAIRGSLRSAIEEAREKRSRKRKQAAMMIVRLIEEGGVSLDHIIETLDKLVTEVGKGYEK